MKCHAMEKIEKVFLSTGIEALSSKTTQLGIFAIVILMLRNIPLLVVAQFLSSLEKSHYSEMEGFRSESFNWQRNVYLEIMN